MLKMGFRVVDKSSFAFATDVPASSRSTHPSGVLHAFRSTPASSEPNALSKGREEHSFAWISNSLHIEAAIKHLEKFDFDRSDGIVFIPYSTKRNWLDHYPHAAPALETTESGEIVVYLNWRPYPNGLSELGKGAGDASQQPTLNEATTASADTNIADDTNINDCVPAKKKRKHSRRKTLNIMQDKSLLPDAERDELHVEIYNYMSWLHEKLSAIERKNEAAEAAAAAAEADSRTATLASEDEVVNNEDDNKAAAARYVKRKKTSINGVNVPELKDVVEKFKSTFAIILNVKLEEEPQDGQSKGAPFIEETLSDALNQLVAARELAGKPKRRSRKWQSKIISGGQNTSNRIFTDFDEMFQRLVQYKEENGDCLVTKTNKEDPMLGNWVCRVREKKVNNLKKGIEFEEVPPGKELTCKTLTAERIEKLNSIGFVWCMDTRPKLSWEVRFQELIEYYEMNGKWPPQSVGTLGDWVHRQRTQYNLKEEKYMRTKAPKLDEIGFEWTPRGYTRMNWDEGFEMMLAFGRLNGHFDVPTNSELDKKSDAHRLHKWVESLHDMYRSSQLGRQSGSLSDERVELLLSHGFVFRNY